MLFPEPGMLFPEPPVGLTPRSLPHWPGQPQAFSMAVFYSIGSTAYSEAVGPVLTSLWIRGDIPRYPASSLGVASFACCSAPKVPGSKQTRRMTTAGVAITRTSPHPPAWCHAVTSEGTDGLAHRSACSPGHIRSHCLPALPPPLRRRPRTPTWVMEPRYVMGLSEGTRVLGMPLVMLPPGTEPRDVPRRHETRGVKDVCNPFPGDCGPADLRDPLGVSMQRTPCP